MLFLMFWFAKDAEYGFQPASKLDCGGTWVAGRSIKINGGG